jgi:hypothetical protein
LATPATVSVAACAGLEGDLASFGQNLLRELSMILNKEKTSARLNINSDLTAYELDALLRKLALLRDELDVNDMEVLIEDKPGLVIAARKEGGFRLWLRHRGYGWLAYQIDNLSATGLHNYLGTRIRPEVNLVSEHIGNTH